MLRHLILDVSALALTLPCHAHIKCAAALTPNAPVFVTPACRHEMFGVGVSVRNRSDQAITAVTVEVRRKRQAEQNEVSTERIPAELNPGQTREVKVPILDLAAPTSRDDEVVLTVRAIEFADGTVWTAPVQ